MIKVIVLFSGGLDSVIVVKLLQEQNIDVIALYIENGFHKGNKYNYLKEISLKLNVKLVIKNSKRDFFKMWKNPKYGYGKALNPCINCHALMTNIALDYMNEINADFIATGEVLEQRGFSQAYFQLQKVIKLINNSEKILRPLSAKLLKKTEMEMNGLVDRNKLLNIKGKSRKIQYELLKKYNLKKEDVESPAGGCILAEKNMKNKMKNLNIKKLKFEDFEIFKYGRHCVLDTEKIKLVLSRNKNEMKQLLKYNSENGTFVKITTNELKSPMGLLNITINELNNFIKNGQIDNRIIRILNETKNKIKQYVKFQNSENDFKIKINEQIEW